MPEKIDRHQNYLENMMQIYAVTSDEAHFAQMGEKETTDYINLRMVAHLVSVSLSLGKTSDDVQVMIYCSNLPPMA